MMVENNALASQNMALETDSLSRLFSSKKPRQENIFSESNAPQIEMPKSDINFENFK
jgi:hypothetical protein